MSPRLNPNIMMPKRTYSTHIRSLETKSIMSRHPTNMHRLDHWEFIYLDSGSIYVSDGIKEIPMKPNEIIFFGPIERHGFYSANENELSTVISCEFDNKSMYCCSLIGCHTVLSPVEKKFISKMLSTKSAISSAKPDTSYKDHNIPTNTVDSKQLIEAELGFLLSSILDRIPNRNSTPLYDTNFAIENKESNNETLTDYILSYLRSNIYGHISLESIANELNYSVSWIKTNFKKNIGIGIIEYFNKIKIDEAKQLLKKDIKIGKVAEILDFYDQTYFNRLFKKHTGLTPSEYRKSFFNDSDDI